MHVVSTVLLLGALPSKAQVLLGGDRGHLASTRVFALCWRITDLAQWQVNPTLKMKLWGNGPLANGDVDWTNSSKGQLGIIQ